MTQMTDEVQVSSWDAFDEDDRAELLAAMTARWGTADGFKPDTAEKAAWLTSRIQHHRAEAERIKQVLRREQERHERAEAGLLAAFGADLEAFARQAIEADGGKRQKHVLPNGVALAFRKLPDGLQVDDEEAALAWAQHSCTEAIVVKRTLSKTALRQWLTETGEIPAGCTPLRDRVGFYVQG